MSDFDEAMKRPVPPSKDAGDLVAGDVIVYGGIRYLVEHVVADRVNRGVTVHCKASGNARRVHDFSKSSRVEVVPIERRGICRECGRGETAPHKPSCETGKVRASRAAFNLSDHAADLRAEKEGRRDF